MKLISFVIPVYEEKEGIAHFLKNELIPEIEKIEHYKKEIVIVNDGSTDGTLEIVQALIRQNDSSIKMRLVSFSRNFGKEIALAAGIHGLPNCFRHPRSLHQTWSYRSSRQQTFLSPT